VIDLVELETIKKQISENHGKIITLMNKYLDAITDRAIDVNEYVDIVKRFTKCALRMCYIPNINSVTIDYIQNPPYAKAYINTSSLSWKKIYATDEVIVHHNSIPLARIFVRYEGEVLRNEKTSYIKVEKVNNVEVEIDVEEEEKEGEEEGVTAENGM